MELTVYRQAVKERPDGTIIYKGEDARPYVDEEQFFVADGLGGAAAIRHQKIRPEMFDEDKLMDTLFAGVYDDHADERFVKYVKQSFYELFAVKDCYNDNVNNLKKSGYFGSRIATAIFLHAMIYDSELKPENIFREFNNREGIEAGKEYLKSLEIVIADKIRNEMGKIAQNANLIYETAFSGLALLGTTLCATIYRETTDKIEAIYFTAGDCRPYIWNEEDGLCQLLRDQEGEDGAMTNYIRANGDKPFEIKCDHFSFDKPCILFNASDGCFDSAAFLSPMGYERLILEKSIEATDEDELGKLLEDFFKDNGRHDDSSTMAMKFFGYSSFEEYKKSAERRMEYLQDTYLSRLPDLLDHKYSEDKENEKGDALDPEMSLKKKFEEETGTWETVKKIYKERNSDNKRTEEIAGKKEGAKQQIIKANDEIGDVVRRNFQFFSYWLRLLDGSGLSDSYDVSKKIDRICSLLYSGKINPNAMKAEVKPEDHGILNRNLAIIAGAESNISKLNKETYAVITDEEIRAFWEEEYRSIIDLLVKDQTSAISEELRKEAESEMYSQQEDKTQSAFELQTELFDRYEKSYNKYMEEQAK